MPGSEPKPVTITIDNATRVSGLLQAPPKARACFVFAHGAGAGMTHPFMAAIATQLAANPLGGLTPADLPLIEAENLSEQPGPPLGQASHSLLAENPSAGG